MDDYAGGARGVDTERVTPRYVSCRVGACPVGCGLSRKHFWLEGITLYRGIGRARSTDGWWARQGLIRIRGRRGVV